MEHQTGLGWRCRLGCAGAIDPAETGAMITSLSNAAFFGSAYFMRRHHLVEHGTTYSEARKARRAREVRRRDSHPPGFT